MGQVALRDLKAVTGLRHGFEPFTRSLPQSALRPRAELYKIALPARLRCAPRARATGATATGQSAQRAPPPAVKGIGHVHPTSITVVHTSTPIWPLTN